MKKLKHSENNTKTKTYNYPPDSHEKFCKRCLKYNSLICPATGKTYTSKTCNI